LIAVFDGDCARIGSNDRKQAISPVPCHQRQQDGKFTSLRGVVIYADPLGNHGAV